MRGVTMPPPQCPAATVVDGADDLRCGVVCGVMARYAEQLDTVLHGVSSGRFKRAAKDPSTVFGFCCGRGLPVVDEIPEGGHGHYTVCPLWRLEKEMIARGDDLIYVPAERFPTDPEGLLEHWVENGDVHELALVRLAELKKTLRPSEGPARDPAVAWARATPDELGVSPA